MAQLSKPAIPMKMYRHFAAASLVLTAGMVVLADNNRSSAEEIPTARSGTPAPASSASQSATPQYGEAQLTRRSGGIDMSPGTFGSENEVSGVDYVNTSVSNSTRMQLPGYSQAYVDSLSHEQYEQLIASLQDSGLLDPAQRSRNLAALGAASRQRSGSALMNGLE